MALAIQHVALRIRHYRKNDTMKNFRYRDELWEQLFLQALKNTSFEGVTVSGFNYRVSPSLAPPSPFPDPCTLSSFSFPLFPPLFLPRSAPYFLLLRFPSFSLFTRILCLTFSLFSLFFLSFSFSIFIFFNSLAKIYIFCKNGKVIFGFKKKNEMLSENREKQFSFQNAFIYFTALVHLVFCSSLRVFMISKVSFSKRKGGKGKE